MPPARRSPRTRSPRAPRTRTPRTRTGKDGGVDASVEALLREATRRLKSRAGEAARTEAEVLLAHVLDVDRARLLALDGVAPEGAARFRALVAEREESARPVAYLTGRRAFRDLELLVDERVLVPRPETELVVDVVEELLAAGRVPPGPFVDRGTGSGALALALAPRRPVLATDLSADALDVAARNIVAWRGGGGTGAVLPCRADGLGGLRPASVAVVVANPPYIAVDEIASLPREVRDHEPRVALVPAEGSVEATFARLAREAAAALRPAGWLVTEIGLGQADLVRRTFTRAGFDPPSVRTDLAGIERVVFAARPG